MPISCLKHCLSVNSLPLPTLLPFIESSQYYQLDIFGVSSSYYAGLQAIKKQTVGTSIENYPSQSLLCQYHTVTLDMRSANGCDIKNEVMCLSRVERSEVCDKTSIIEHSDLGISVNTPISQPLADLTISNKSF